MAKYSRNSNSTYSQFVYSYAKKNAEFATQITVRDTEEGESRPRRGVRASLALGGIGAGYALGKNPEAQQVLKDTGISLKDRMLDKAMEYRTKYDLPEAAPVSSVVNKIREKVSLPQPDSFAMPNMFGNYPSQERAQEAAQLANDLGLNPHKWFGGGN